MPTAHRTPSPRTHLSHVTGLPGSIDDSRFEPGTLIAERYRIVGMLGKGGMGEVYRAHDLVLGQQVALKFLPESLSQNAGMIARFYSEVRVARQVSHPNVCRVYDIGEIDGMLYLSMEYVNGEDLGSLLRRIGRLPSDKAAEIARKICAGLAAAHEKGILHRDLKPANIMLDGSGQISIMDFGLAGVAAQITGAEIRNGTPAYMAPEQLAGREVTIRSDIYALGLVLYEIFTGKRPFDASSLAELMKMQESGTPVSISSVVRDLDPAVEKVIVRCLSPDPKDRPASALLVAAALPGGDPIAAALAAGETPSPHLIAVSGEVEGLPPKIAIASLLWVILGLIGVAALSGYANSPLLDGLEYPPEVLQHKAREVALKLGYAKPGFSISAFILNGAYARYAAEHRINVAQPHGPNQMLMYWVRESPTAIYTTSFITDIGITVPAFTQPGMRRMLLDTQGDLLSFEAVAPAYASPAGNGDVDWKPLFDAAGIDPATLVEAQPIVKPTVPVEQAFRVVDHLRSQESKSQGRFGGSWIVARQGGLFQIDSILGHAEAGPGKRSRTALGRDSGSHLLRDPDRRLSAGEAQLKNAPRRCRRLLEAGVVRLLAHPNRFHVRRLPCARSGRVGSGAGRRRPGKFAGRFAVHHLHRA